MTDEWRLLSADGPKCWQAVRAEPAAGMTHALALYGNDSFDAFTVVLPAVSFRTASLIELRDRLGSWLGLPLQRWPLGRSRRRSR